MEHLLIRLFGPEACSILIAYLYFAKYFFLLGYLFLVDLKAFHVHL